MDHLTITRPDDWHIHLRDEAALPTTVRDVGRVFKRAIVMPNLVPPVTSAEAVNAYRERIIAARPEDNPFEPLMTL
ncbi:MAG: dihydroorotase, partial [Gammaproteobacteria bacterium]